MTDGSMRIAVAVATVWAAASFTASAREIAPSPQATYEALFTPGDAIDARIVALIDDAKAEVLVNAFTFTSRRIARALGGAHARGVHVEIVADRGQALDAPASAVLALARLGISVWLDSNFVAAHNKVIIVDGTSPQAAVVTGSYNYTGAAQSRNAENVLIVRHDSPLATQYRANFVRLRDHAQRYEGNGAARR